MIKDPIQFWTARMQDHCLFLHDGIIVSSEGLSEELSESREAKKVQKALSVAKEMKTLAKSALNSWIVYHNNRDDENQLSKAMEITRLVKESMRDHLKANQWIGYNYLGVVEHMIKELNLLQSHIDESWTMEYELIFWQQHNPDDIALMGHLLDPGEPCYTKIFLKAAHQGNRISVKNIKKLIEFVQQDLEMNEEIKQDQPAHIIHPLLALHEKKEHEYCLYRLKKFLNEN